MYRSIIRDPGGGELVRIVSELQAVDGSVLVVPPDTVAYLVCGGHVSPAYPPGSYRINTGTSPFFVRLQHLMTNGQIPETVSVFFVSQGVETVMQMGTGEMLYQHADFDMTMMVRAPFVVRFHISEPKIFLSRLLGMYQSQFSQEDLAPAMEAMLTVPVKELLLRSLTRFGAVVLQTRLLELSRELTRLLKPELRQYGMTLKALCVTGINLSQEDLVRLQGHQQQIARWKAQTAAEEEHIRRVYGSLQNRTMVEMLTGVPRGLNPGTSVQAPAAGGANMAGQMAALSMQMAMYNQIFANMRDPLTEMANQSNLFTPGTETRPQEGNASPALTAELTCIHCGAALADRTASCPVCGSRLTD